MVLFLNLSPGKKNSSNWCLDRAAQVLEISYFSLELLHFYVILILSFVPLARLKHS